MRAYNKEFKYGLSLAPLAGYSNRAMRTLAYGCGAEWCTTEMVSAKAITFGDKKTLSLAKIGEGEGPVALQIFGSEPEVMARGTELILKGLSDGGSALPIGIDINMGCPVKKIFTNNEGSALMKNPELIYKIVKAVRGACNLPVSVKLRAGIDGEHINAVECALAAEDAGCSLITVHGRTRADMYSGNVKREVIKAVKESTSVPVIANGDVADAKSAVAMLEYTGADGLAVGRGAVGNPFVFSEIRAALTGLNYVPPTLDERINLAKKHIIIAVEDKGERVGIPESRGAVAAYFSGFRGAAAIRGEVNRAESLAEILKIIEGAKKYELS